MITFKLCSYLEDFTLRKLQFHPSIQCNVHIFLFYICCIYIIYIHILPHVFILQHIYSTQVLMYIFNNLFNFNYVYSYVSLCCFLPLSTVPIGARRGHQISGTWTCRLPCISKRENQLNSGLPCMLLTVRIFPRPRTILITKLLSSTYALNWMDISPAVDNKILTKRTRKI